MSVTKGDTRSQLERRRPGMSESDDPIQPQLVQVWRFELTHMSEAATTWRTAHLQHDLDAPVADLLPRGLHALAPVLVTEAGLDKILAVFHQEVPYGLLADRRDLDELGETVADLYGCEQELRQLWS